MLIKTMLNRCTDFKCFVFGRVKFTDQMGRQGAIEVEIYPRKNSRANCSECGKPCGTYDTSPEPRRFEFIPILGFAVYFLYRMRRVNCVTCGVKVEQVPWGSGKRELTTHYMQFLANWSRCLSWKEVSERFHTSWDKVFRSVEYIVQWGLKHRNLEGITAIGVDEIQWSRGHKYLTLVYQINSGCVRLLWIGVDRSQESFSRFFDFLGKQRCQKIEFVCSDMWKAYLKVIRERVGQAVHILDRFHIVANLNKALDKVRAEEHRQMKFDGYEPLLTKSRWILLKKPENLKDEQTIKLKDLLKYNLRSMRAYLLKEDFQQLWSYTYAAWASQFIDQWTKKVMLSKIEPLKKQARSIRKHKHLILNWFRAKKQLSSSVVEGLNNKAKLTMRKSYGFKSTKTIQIALYHSLGKLPEPPLTHRFY